MIKIEQAINEANEATAQADGIEIFKMLWNLTVAFGEMDYTAPDGHVIRGYKNWDGWVTITVSHPNISGSFEACPEGAIQFIEGTMSLV